MFDDNQYTEPFERLRKQAEKLLLNSSDCRQPTVLNFVELVEELNIHQSELRIQNEELKRSQQHNESLLREYVGLYYDFAPCGYVTLSPKGLITRINLAGSSLLKTDRLNLKYSTLSSFISEICHMNYFMTLKRAARTGERQSAELKLKPDDRWVVASIQPDMEESGELRQWRITLSDISVYKQHEILLKEREERFRFLFESAPFGCQFLNRDAHIIEVNRCWEETTGYSRSQVVEKDFADFIHPDWVGAFKKSYARLQSGDAIDLELMLAKKEGSYFHVNAQAKPYMDKNRVLSHSCLCFHPLAESEPEKIYSSSKLHHSLPDGTLIRDEKQFLSIMEALPLSFMQLDTEGHIIFANRACHTILGSNPDTLNGRFCWDLASNRESEGYIKKWFKHNIDHLTFPESFQAQLKIYRDRDLTFKIDWNYKYSVNGKVKGMILHMADISEQKQKEYRLEHALECQSAEILKLRQKLEREKLLKETLTQQLDENRSKVEKAVLASVKTLVLPYVEQLKNYRSKNEQKELLNILESNLNEITSTFVKDLNDSDSSFTPMEIKIAHLIRQSKTNKEIARILSVSIRTVEFHRDNLRAKLGIKNRQVNLRSLLLSRFK